MSPDVNTRIFGRITVVLGMLSILTAVFCWSYLIVGFLLWNYVFGDNFRYPGLVAIAIAIPLSITITGAFGRLAARHPAKQGLLAGGVVVAIGLIVFFFYCISA
jgi:uncharacterized protein YjeT (DUF2065 family)